MMKKPIAGILAAVLALSMAGCGTTAAEDPATLSQTMATIPTVTVTEPAPEATEPAEEAALPTTAPTEAAEPTAPTEAAHRHRYASAVTASTCTQDGYTTYTCACGERYVADQTKAMGHRETATVTAPTCTADGYTTYACACGYSHVADPVEATGHSYGPWVTVKAPTCAAPGIQRRTCACGSSETALLRSAGHSYTSTVTKAATCTAEGILTHICTHCRIQTMQQLKTLPHQYTGKETPPTCTAQGYTTYTCSHCGDHYEDDYTAAKGHSYANGSCVNCGQSQNACSHTNTTTERVESTCSTQGYEKVICKDCGKTISSIKLPIGTCSFTKTMNLAEAAVNYFYSGNSDASEFSVYSSYRDWLVNVCPGCGYLDIDSRRFANSAMEEAQIMLDYVNQLREDTYGTSAWNMKLDAKLVELAQIRIKELEKNFSHTHDTYTNASENIAAAGPTIKAQFDVWNNSYGHHTNMLNTRYEFFGYARWEGPYGTVYGVQMFWDEGMRDTYYMVIEEG